MQEAPRGPLLQMLERIPLALWLTRVYSKHWVSADQKGQLPVSQKEPQSMVIMLDNLKQCISPIYHAAFDESAHRPIKQRIDRFPLRQVTAVSPT